MWLAQRFTDEHRAALDWLNEKTNEDINFFGLEVELWRIGNSPIAPKFNIVSSPNDWTKHIAKVAKNAQELSLTPAKQLQVEFWTAFRDYVDAHGATFKPTKPLAQHWMNISIGRSGFKLNAVASQWDSSTESYDQHEIRAELEMTDVNSKTYYSQLLAQKLQIEAEMGTPLIWYNPENKRVCRIFLRNTANLDDRGAWPRYFDWLKINLELLQRAFAQRVRMLDADRVAEDETTPLT